MRRIADALAALARATCSRRAVLKGTGALIVGVFRNGLALAGVQVLWQEFTVGALIIVAVAIDQWLRRVSQ